MDVIEIIRNTIINMDKPFLVSDLLEKLKSEHQITDLDTISEVLDSLINEGLVSLSEIEYDVWGYQSNFSIAS